MGVPILVWVSASFGATPAAPDWADRFYSDLVVPYAIAADGDGNVYVTGTFDSGEVPPGKPPDICTDDDACEDWITLKYSPDGQRAWSAQYRGPGRNSDTAYAIAPDPSGAVYVAGTAIQPDGANAITLVKYSAAGEEVWARTLSASSDPYAQVLAARIDDDGSIVVTGSACEAGPGCRRLTAKWAPDGTEVWVAARDGALVRENDGKPGSLAIDGGGNIYVTAAELAPDRAEDGIVTIKYSPAGEEEWARLHEVPRGLEESSAVAVDGAGNVYVAGSSGSSSGSPLVLLKYGPGGEEIWARGGSGMAGWIVPAALLFDADGGPIVAGTVLTQAETRKIAAAKYSAGGDLMWYRAANAGLIPIDAVRAAAPIPGGGVLVAGSGGGRVPVVRFSEDGDDVEWWDLRGPDDFVFARQVALRADGSCWVAGELRTPPAAGSITLKYSLAFGPRFRRGDADGDGTVGLTDAIFALTFLFLGGPPAPCPDAMDADDDGAIEITDAIFVLGYLYLAGVTPPDPGPTGCGVDPTADALGCPETRCP